MINIDNIDKAIIQQLINFPNKKDEDIAKDLKISVKEYKTRVNTHDFKYAFGEAAKTFEHQMDDIKGLAARKLKQLLNDSDKKIVLEAIKAVLGSSNKSNSEPKDEKKTAYEKRLSKKLGLD